MKSPVEMKSPVFYQNSLVISPGLLYHLIRRSSGRLASKAFTSNRIASSKQWLNGLKITNWLLLKVLLSQHFFDILFRSINCCSDRPIKHYFLKEHDEVFHVDIDKCFNKFLRFLAEFSTNLQKHLQKMHYFGQFKGNFHLLFEL